MITALGPLWQSADLTGNSQFLVVPSGGPEPYIYVVTNSLSDGTFNLLKSSDRGETFEIVATGSLGVAVQFDPAVLFDGTYIHILGSKPNGVSEDLVKFRHAISNDNTTTPPVLTAVTLLSGRKIHSAYDLTNLYDGSILIVTTLTDATGYAMKAIHMDTSDAVTSTETIGSVSSIRTGEVYGGISLVVSSDLGSSDVELYYTAHQKAFTFGSISQEIRLRTFSTDTEVWSDPETLKGLISYYSDDNLTVLKVGDNRVACSLYYSQVRGSLISTLVLGSRIDGTWSWVEYGGTTYQSYASPVLTVDSLNTVCLSVLVGDLNRKVARSLKISVLNIGNLTFIPRNGSFNRLYFNWIRGTKTAVTEDSKWGLVGERAVFTGSTLDGYAPYYASELNLLPSIVVTPSSGTIRRGILFPVSAEASVDADADTIGIEWSTDDTSGHVHLLDSTSGEELVVPPTVPYSHPKSIDILVDKEIGPDAYSFDLTASGMDFTLAGTQIHLGSPSTTTSSFSIAENTAPTIEWTANPFQATRNSVIVLAPVKDDAESDSLTYSWEQTSGETLELVSTTDLPYLTVRTHGVSTLGAQVQFTFTVSDGINAPVSSVLYVNIPAVNTYGLDDRYLSRGLYRNTHGLSSIVSRNNKDGLSEWVSPVIGGITTNFFKTRVINNIDSGYQRMVYISPRSVAVFGPEDTFQYYYRKVLLPNNDRGMIVDGLQNEVDDIYVLTDEYRLLRYTEAHIGPDNTSDYWQEAISIKPLLGSGSVKWFEASTPTDGKRVMAFVTTGGLLLIEIDDVTFRLREDFFLTIEDGGLYGGDDVLFVRFLDVESLHTGKVLIGSSNVVNNVPNYFETVFDLNKGKIVNVWDRLNRTNKEVYTGEIFDLSTVHYSGRLQAPVLSVTPVDDSSADLAWIQVRPDLVDDYTIYVDSSTGIPGTSAQTAPSIDVFKSLSASPIDYGQTVTLRFKVTGAEYLSMNLLFSDLSTETHQLPLGTTAFTTVVKKAATYTLQARNTWGVTSKDVTLSVNEVAPEIVVFDTSSTSISSGDPVTFSWDVVGADALIIDQGIGYCNPELSTRTTYPAVSGAYTLYASNPYGMTTSTVTITVS